MAVKDIEPSVNPRLEANRLKALRSLRTYLETPGRGILHDHQKPVMGKLHSFLSDGGTAGHIIQPTGSGKTVVATEIIQALGLNTIVVSPTGEILDKTKATIERFAPELTVSNYDGRVQDLRGNVINTTLPSLQKIAEIPAVAEEVELIVVDEVDFGTLGTTRHELWRKFPNALFLGLTATPDFSQLEELQRKGKINPNERWTGMFTNNIHEMTREEAQEQGALAPLDIHLVTTSYVVGNVHTKKGEYDDKEIERLLNVEARNIQIIALLAGVDAIPPSIQIPVEKRAELQRLHEQIKGKRTFVFGLGIKHIEALAERLRDANIRAAAVHGKLPRETQTTILNAHQEGTLPVVLGVDLLGRGVDSPATVVGIFARPRLTDAAAIQEVGRLLRISPETGKTRAIAIQLVDFFEDPTNAPVLLPEVVDPDYVLRGRRGGIGGERRTSGQTKDERDATITISGMDIVAVEELMTQARMRKRIESAGSLSEINDILDNVITTVREQDQGESVLGFYRELVKFLPARISKEVQLRAFEALSSPDSDIRKLGQKIFLLLNLKTVFSATAPYFSENEANNEDVFQLALVQLLERMDSADLSMSISAGLHPLIQSGEVPQFVADEEGVEQRWLREKAAQDMITTVDSIFESREGEPLTQQEIDRLVAHLVSKTGYDQQKIREFVMFRHTRAFPDSDYPGPDSTVETVIQNVLRETIESVLGTISEREAGIVRLRVGLDGESKTFDEIAQVYGVTRERIRQIDSTVMSKLRHPGRSGVLRGFWGDNRDE